MLISGIAWEYLPPIAAARRKGKWSGGRPILKFDVDSRDGRLLVNEGEAMRVRTIYDL